MLQKMKDFNHENNGRPLKVGGTIMGVVVGAIVGVVFTLLVDSDVDDFEEFEVEETEEVLEE